MLRLPALATGPRRNRILKEMSNKIKQEPSPGTEHWDRYWAHGFVTSCAVAFKGNYEGNVRGLWEDFFAALESQSNILDIGTGNGAIAIIAAEIGLRKKKAFAIHGVDQAKINPAAILGQRPGLLGAITFHSQTPAEKTPFSDASFQAITGQYALEYTPVETTIAELSRIAAPGAQGMFVIHHDDSIVLTVTREELRTAGVLFSQADLFEQTREVVRSVAPANTPEKKQALIRDSLAQRRRDAFNRAAALVTDALTNTTQPEMLQTALGHVGEALKNCAQWGLEQSLTYLDGADNDIKANIERLRDLIRVSSSPDRVEELLTMFRDAGFETDGPDTIYHDMPVAPEREKDTRLMGWVLRVRRT